MIDPHALYLAHAKAVQWHLNEYPRTLFYDGSPKGIRLEVWTDPGNTLKVGGVTGIEKEFLEYRWGEYESIKAGDDV